MRRRSEIVLVPDPPKSGQLVPPRDEDASSSPESRGPGTSWDERDELTPQTQPQPQKPSSSRNGASGDELGRGRDLPLAAPPRPARPAPIGRGEDEVADGRVFSLPRMLLFAGLLGFAALAAADLIAGHLTAATTAFLLAILNALFALLAP